MLKKVKILSANYLGDINIEINKYVLKGYTLEGNLVVYKANKLCFYQTMVLKDEKD